MKATVIKPNENISDIDAAFPAKVSHLMPPMSEIPEEFKSHGSNKWLQFQSDWFFRGIRKIKAKAKEGIDERAAWRHMTCIQGSYEPPHEHKKAAVAYLASLWFDEISYETDK